jgi:hypothetical protein
MLKANGALLFQAEKGNLWAIFDEAFVMAFASPEIEGTAPALTCRSLDVERLQIGKDTLIVRDSFKRKVLRAIPDGAGQTILMLAQ